MICTKGNIPVVNDRFFQLPALLFKNTLRKSHDKMVKEIIKGKKRMLECVGRNSGPDGKTYSITYVDFSVRRVASIFYCPPNILSSSSSQ